MAEDGFKPRTAIIGLGLLGTSLAMALKARGYRVSGWTRRGEVRDWALSQGIIDETASTAAEILNRADLTVICLPIPQINVFVREHARDWRAGAAVTDIGSVKETIVAFSETVLAAGGAHFVGSHPMAGTEKSGPEHAFKDLYSNAEVFVTRTVQTNVAALTTVRRMWEAIGTKVTEIGVKEHDILVAHTSHIPHLLAYALSLTVLGCGDSERQLRYSGCATGFRDTSRISSSSPLMWREIIENNRSAVLEAVRDFDERWQQLKTALTEGDFDALQQEFSQGKQLRDAWVEYKNSGK